MVGQDLDEMDGLFLVLGGGRRLVRTLGVDIFDDVLSEIVGVIHRECSVCAAGRRDI